MSTRKVCVKVCGAQIVRVLVGVRVRVLARASRASYNEHEHLTVSI